MTNELAYEILKGIIGITETDVEEQGSEEGGVLTVECLKVALDALEKQIPKEPKTEKAKVMYACDNCANSSPPFECKYINDCIDGDLWEEKEPLFENVEHCPECGLFIGRKNYIFFQNQNFLYCEKCGKKIRWERR